MAGNIKKCPICLIDLKLESPLRDDAYEISCYRCGDFKITRTAATIFTERDYDNERRVIASSLIRKRGYAFYHDKNDDIFDAKDISVLDKCDNLLLHIERNTRNVGIPLEWGDIVSYEGQAYCWAKDWTDMEGLAELLFQMGRLSIQKTKNVGGDIQFVSITAKGWERLEQLRTINVESNQGFVAMWFADKMRHVYDSAIDPAIRQAGYSPFRVDSKEHVGKIDDEIILQIRRSRFLIADATGHRGGVYYEAGFAHGLGLPVFLTCREEDMNDLHFDIRQYNCISWREDALEEFTQTLSRRIEAVLGKGCARS